MLPEHAGGQHHAGLRAGVRPESAVRRTTCRIVHAMSEPADVVLPESVTRADGEGGLPVLRVRAPGGAWDIYLTAPR